MFLVEAKSAVSKAKGNKAHVLIEHSHRRIRTACTHEVATNFGYASLLFRLLNLPKNCSQASERVSRFRLGPPIGQLLSIGLHSHIYSLRPSILARCSFSCLRMLILSTKNELHRLEGYFHSARLARSRIQAAL